MVLFDRAKWCELDTPSKRHEVRGRNGKPLSIEVMPARIVLLEWPTGAEGKLAQSPPNVLGTGFLMLDVRFLNLTSTWDLEDVLAFSEDFRYWRRPGPGHETEDRAGYVYKDLIPDFNSESPYFDRWASLLRHPVKIGESHFSLFPSVQDGTAWLAEARNWQESSTGKPGWIPYADNRAFVWSCALLQNGL